MLEGVSRAQVTLHWRGEGQDFTQEREGKNC